MPIRFILIITFFLANLFSSSKNFSEVVILASTNVHGEVDPCG